MIPRDSPKDGGRASAFHTEDDSDGLVSLLTRRGKVTKPQPYMTAFTVRDALVAIRRRESY